MDGLTAVYVLYVCMYVLYVSVCVPRHLDEPLVQPQPELGPQTVPLVEGRCMYVCS